MPYTITSGDTLGALAISLGFGDENPAALDALIAANPQFATNPGLISPGQVVSLPNETGGEEGGGTDGGSAPSAGSAPIGGGISIRPGAEWIGRWNGPGQGTTWHAVWTLPGGTEVYYEATAEELQAIFGGQAVPGENMNQNFFANRTRDAFFGGFVSEQQGDEPLAQAYQRAIAGTAGGLLPAWLEADPRVTDLLYVAETEGWSQEQLINEIAQTDAFGERFPAIKNFYDIGLDPLQAVQGYREYEQQVNQLTVDFMGRPASNEEIGLLLDQGHSVNAVNDTFGVFKRISNHAPALQAFQDVLVAQGIQPFGAQDIFDFVSGRAEPELYEIYEAASVQEASLQTGLNRFLTASEAIQIANSTPGVTSPEAALGALSQAAQTILLNRGNLDFGRHGLDADDIIDLSLGISPRSGRSQIDLADGLSRALREASAQTGRTTTTPFRQFTPTGTPQAVSLGGLTPER